MPNISAIKIAIKDSSKKVYFAAGGQTTISWREVFCQVVDVANKAYFKVRNFSSIDSYYIDIIERITISWSFDYFDLLSYNNVLGYNCMGIPKELSISRAV